VQASIGIDGKPAAVTDAGAHLRDGNFLEVDDVRVQFFAGTSDGPLDSAGED
jgi:hypothetical protein